MIYSEIYFKQKQKISSLVILLTFLLTLTFFLSIFYKHAIPSKASKINIKRVEITNLSPIQTTIFWQTNEKQQCWLIYGEEKNKLDKIVFDDRDIKEQKKKYFNHYSTLRNLKSGKTYYFSIICDNKKIIKPDGQYFSFKTPETINNLTKLNPISGKVLNENLLPLSEGIILLSINNKELFPLSYALKNSGEWLITLNSFYNKNDFLEKNLTENEIATIEIFTEDNKKTTIIGSLKKLSEKNQVIIIGKNYNLLEDESNVLSASDFNDINKNKIDIIYPKENSLIPGKRPLIKGIALSHSFISLNIKSDKKNYSINLKADKNGNWLYSLPEDLDLGKYQIIFLTKDEKGKDINIIRNFTITGNDAFEGKVLGTASQESEIKPTYNLPSLTPTEKIIYTSPTLILSKKPPVSGNTDFLSIIASLSFILAGIGILFIF